VVEQRKVEGIQAKLLLENWLSVMGFNSRLGITKAADALDKNRRSLERVLASKGSLSHETRLAMSAIYSEILPWGDILQYEDKTMSFITFENITIDEVKNGDEIRVAVPSGWLNEKRYLDGIVGHIQKPYVLFEVKKSFEPGVLLSSEQPPNFVGKKFAVKAGHIYIARRADGTQYAWPNETASN